MKQMNEGINKRNASSRESIFLTKWLFVELNEANGKIARHKGLNN